MCHCWILRAPGSSAREYQGEGAGLRVHGEGAAVLMGDGDQPQLPDACLKFSKLNEEEMASV